MLPISQQELRQLLLHPECPWSTVLRTYGESVILIRLFRQFAKLQGYDPDIAEALMADFVIEQGGRRATVQGPRMERTNGRRGIVVRSAAEAGTEAAWMLPQCKPMDPGLVESARAGRANSFRRRERS